jgi:hypothetical protein
VTVSEVVSLLESCEDNICKEEQWEKITVGRKRSSSIEMDCFEKIAELLQHR